MLNRRNFLKNLGLTGSLLTMPSVLLNARSVSKATTLKGKVQSEGKGIAGVPVTDGSTIVLTDKNGQYELESNTTAEFVYISVPAGYAIPEYKGIASFYKRIKDSRNDFTLEKLKVDDHKHTFVVWADPQMKSKKDVELLMSESVPDLQAVVKSYPKDTLIHGIGC